MFTAKFWKDAVERAVRAGAWAFLSALGLDAYGNDLDTTWQTRLTLAGGAAAFSLVASLAGTARPSGDDTGSLVT